MDREIDPELFYAAVDVNGRPTQFFTFGLNGAAIPDDAVALTDDQVASLRANPRQLLIDGHLRPDPDAPILTAPPPTSCSKLGLKRAFDEKKLWTTVRAMIASDAGMQEDWDLAVELRITDPIVRKAVAGLAQLGIPLSDADVQALVTRANALVA